ncbi:MAG: hypothetical protein HC923_11690 [Myxococcales bacterium]|nr:hypothetical protein [Myxococcales bacterium]
MSRLEAIDGSNWEDFVKSKKAVLMLGKSDCGACNEWTQELKDYLAETSEHSDVRFGKMLLDQRGLASFKKEHTWLKDVDALPYNVIFKDGEVRKTFAGKGVERLTNRLGNLDE